MKRSHVIVILLLGLLVSAGALLLPAQPENPIAILPLGRPSRDIIEFFQITNRSSAVFIVTCKTMVKTNGVWKREPHGCVIMSYDVPPYSAHKEMAIVPLHGESWRLVAEYYRSETRLSRAVDMVRRMFKLPAKSRQTNEVKGPEMRRFDV